MKRQSQTNNNQLTLPNAKQAARISQQELESYLWGAATRLRGYIDAGDYKQFIFPLLFFKRVCDVYDEEFQNALNESGGDLEFAAFAENHRFQIPAGAHWREVRSAASEVGRAIQNAMRAIETANPERMYGIFGDAQWTNKERLPDETLRDLMEHYASLTLSLVNVPEDELGNAYEYLIKKFADDSGHTAAEFYTNRTVVHLMTELLEPEPGESVYDPTCGSGGMLLSCVTHLKLQGKEARTMKLYGQERNLMTSAIARMNLFLHGIEDFHIARGDTLAEPKFLVHDRLRQFDLILANPPYSIKQWSRQAWESDPYGRNQYGVPPQGRADYAFFQHILASLNPKTGRCAILFPHGVLFRDEEQKMRAQIVEADLIECVIGLGPNLFYNSPMEACIVICHTHKPRARRNKILFINAVDEVTRERAQSFLEPDHIARIVRVYREFVDEAGFSRVVGLKEIQANTSNLNLALYVRATITRESAGEYTTDTLGTAIEGWRTNSVELRNSMEELLKQAGNIQESVPQEIKQNATSKDFEWLKTIPVSAMSRHGYIQTTRSNKDQLNAAFKFFGIANSEQWKQKWQSPLAEYRKSRHFTADPGALSAWLRKGEIEAEKINTQTFDANLFRNKLREIRSLTVEPVEIFLPQLVAFSALAGVAVVFVPELPKTHVWGVTRWLSPTKALIQLSLRYKTDDHFWFTFFHEAGHILLHGTSGFFLEAKSGKTAQEREANQFAEEWLIPQTDLDRFLKTFDKSKEAIREFAQSMGIAPGIVVSRLQHEALLPRNYGYDLKRTIELTTRVDEPATAKILKTRTSKKEWRTVHFGDVVRNVDITERKPLESGLERLVGLEHLDPESLHIKRWGNIADGTSFTRKFVKGQVLFGKRRVYQRKAAVAEFDGLCSSDILVFEPKGDELLPELLPFIVQSEGFFQKAMGTSAGSLSPRTKWKDLATYRFALPPKEEQRRMAEVLWAIDALQNAEFEMLNELRAFASTLAMHLIPTTENDRSVPLTISNFPTVRPTKLGQAGVEIEYGLSLPIPKDGARSGIRIVSTADITLDGTINYQAIRRIDIESKLPPRLLLEESDILFNWRNSPDHIGKSALFSRQPEPLTFASFLLKIRCDEAISHSAYVCRLLNLMRANGYFKHQCRRAVNQAAFNKNEVADLLIFLPPYEEQVRIARKLEEVNGFLRSRESHIKLIEALKAQLLKPSFD